MDTSIFRKAQARPLWILGLDRFDRALGVVPMPNFRDAVLPVVMLFASNVFMTFAWYGHLKFKSVPLPLVIVVSWSIAFFEYCLAVPANRLGSAVYRPVELKTIQEIVTLLVFAGFSTLYLGERLSWNQGIGFVFLVLAAFFLFRR
jgi:uncharacterized protein (DUF486 family)